MDFSTSASNGARTKALYNVKYAQRF